MHAISCFGVLFPQRRVGYPTYEFVPNIAELNGLGKVTRGNNNAMSKVMQS
jgi:hypothetical protein